MPWDQWCEEVQHEVHASGLWEGPLSQALEAATSHLANLSIRTREQCAKRGWTTPEALIRGWAAARRMQVTWDADRDYLALRLKPRKVPKDAAIQPKAWVDPALQPLFTDEMDERKSQSSPA